MIRINLIPVRQVRKVQAGQRQLLLFFGLIAVELGAMAVLYLAEADAIEKRQEQVSTIKAEIEALKREVGDYDRLQTQRQQLISQRNVINELSSSRVGPVWALREMSAILSASGRPTFDEAAYTERVRRNPNAAFNVKWNPRRLWLETMVEAGGRLELSGKAKDYDDVAEFLKRLDVSQYYDDIRLKRNDQVADTKLGLKVIKFGVSCKVHYARVATQQQGGN